MILKPTGLNPARTTIEAVRLTEENAEEVARWCFGKVMRWREKNKPRPFVGVRFQTLSGMGLGFLTAYAGDYVVRTGPNGPVNFTVMDADTIRYKYEEVTA